jgi:cyanate permease
VNSDLAPPRPDQHPFRWGVLAGVWLVYFSFGLSLSALAPLVPPISRDLNLSYGAMGSILGAWPLIYIFVAIPCGALIDRIGLNRALLLAAAIMGVSGILRSLAVDHVTLFLAVALFGIGGPLISIGAPKAIAQWFHGPERGLAMGIYITGPSLGGMLSLSLTNSVFMPMMGEDWRAVLLLYAAVPLFGGLVWFLLNRNPTSRAVDMENRGDGSIAGQVAIFGQLLRIGSVQLVLLMAIGIFFFYHSLASWLPEILRNGGMAATSAGLWAAAPVAVGIVGSLIIPRLATPERRFPILLGMFVSAGIGAAFLFSDSLAGVAGAVFFQGLARGSLMTIAILVLMESKGVEPRHMGAAGGLYFTAAEVGGVAGPVTLGLLFDASGTFDLGFYVLIGICVALVMLLFMHRSAERAQAG